MPPSMSSSDALVIWMLRIAMKAPIMLARTAIHAVALAFSVVLAGGAKTVKELRDAARATLDMVVPPRQRSALNPGVLRERPRAGPATWCRWSDRPTCRGAARR